ncbi:MAG TPA: acyl-CoA thioesterase [Bacteroidales bacterium]|nr:acyl-CoA thioesterase [Bacteroidales bacterium]HPT52146.1 acyl-CoA thioesterase [Bacteroidales bacterium]
MNNPNLKLTATKNFDVRFSEVDSMNIVWHGNYALYFEDARELFGKKYGLEYLFIYENGFYTPLVELHLNYKQPIRYQDNVQITITYRNTDAAKIIFDYEIVNLNTHKLMVKGYSVQVFLDKDYQLVWNCPTFYQNWKKEKGLL